MQNNDKEQISTMSQSENKDVQRNRQRNVKTQNSTEVRFVSILATQLATRCRGGAVKC